MHVSRSSLLSFVPLALQVQRVEPTSAEVSIEAEPRRTSASCPACGSCSVRIHSRYRRMLRDLPWQGRPVTIHLAARRFRCANVACARKTFSERLGDVAPVSARRTERLADLQRHLALALGGEAGARLAVRIAISTSPDTLLRMATATTPNETAPSEPRVIAVDDWAWRRGHSYGTILVDLQHNQVIDLLPDRQAETLATWLRKHPTIEIVARDRAGAYADGVRQGAPQAIQVADRWHMLRNLSDAVRAVVDRQHRAIRRVSKEISEERTEPSAAMSVVSATVAKPSAAAQRSQDAYARRQARYEEAVKLKEAGVSLSRTAALMGAERKTIRRWLRSGGAARWRKPPGVGVLTPYLDVLCRRWSEGCRNAALLWRELTTLGFSGRPGIVRSWAGQQRKSEPTVAASPSEHTTPSSFPSAREVARLLMIDPAGLPNLTVS
jgi:transposase